jgi:hypothetical protein
MIDLVLMRLAGECGSEEVCGYWFDFWDYSQYSTFLTAEKRHTICGIRPPTLQQVSLWFAVKHANGMFDLGGIRGSRIVHGQKGYWKPIILDIRHFFVLSVLGILTKLSASNQEVPQ